MRDPKYVIPRERNSVASNRKAGKILPLSEHPAHLQSQSAHRESRKQKRDSNVESEKILETENLEVAGIVATENEDSAEAKSQELRKRAGFMYNLLSKIALRTAPLASWIYDCQMSFGKGVRVASHRLQLPHYPPRAPALKVAYLSDLHYGPTTGKVANRQAWKLVREANPDVILLGGDYLYADERGLPTLLRELQRWKFSPPPGGIYACLGNHDYYAGKETLITTLEACGVKVLINDAVPLPSPWKGIWIAGTDDLWHGKPDLEATLAQTSPDACTILLSHEPDICESSLMRRVAMTLCGHTHGGQICLPNGDPIYVPSKHGKEYSAGLYRHAGQWLFVSRGVGTVGLPIRLFAPPDVGIFEFHGRASR